MVITLGLLVHNIVPRSWRLAFGEWTIPRGVNAEGDDYHKVVRSIDKMILMDWLVGVRYWIYW